MFLLLLYYICRLKTSGLSDESNQFLNILLIPLGNLVLLGINIVGELLKALEQDGWWIVLLDEIVYMTPLLNWFFFIHLCRKNIIFTAKIRNLRWLFCMCRKNKKSIL